MKQAVTFRLQTVDTNFLYTGIQVLVPQLEGCFKLSVVDYVEV